MVVYSAWISTRDPINTIIHRPLYLKYNSSLYNRKPYNITYINILYRRSPISSYISTSFLFEELQSWVHYSKQKLGILVCTEQQFVFENVVFPKDRKIFFSEIIIIETVMKKHLLELLVVVLLDFSCDV